MPKIVNVYVDYYKEGTKVGRQAVPAELIEDRGNSILVRLPDGNQIKRKKSRDIADATIEHTK